MFYISCVTGHNLPLLQTFLQLLPVDAAQHRHKVLSQLPAEFHVDELFNVEGVGLVLGGILKRGVVQEGEGLLIGPMASGEFTSTVVKSIRFRTNRAPCRQMMAGQAATLTVTGIDRSSVRKVCTALELVKWVWSSLSPQGTVLLSEGALDGAANSCSEFEVELQLLHSSNTCVRRGFQATIYIDCIMQNAVIDNIHDKVGNISPCLTQEAHLHPPSRTHYPRGRKQGSIADSFTTQSS